LWQTVTVGEESFVSFDDILKCPLLTCLIIADRLHSQNRKIYVNTTMNSCLFLQIHKNDFANTSCLASALQYWNYNNWLKEG